MCETTNKKYRYPSQVGDARTIPLDWGILFKLKMEINKNRFNKGTIYGFGLITRSIEKLGCGRSVLCDKNDKLVCGNDVYKISQQLGKKIKVVETDGDTLVVVKRVDLDADSKKGKELALVDNLSQQKNLEWNAEGLLQSMEQDMSFDPRSWGGHSCLVKELDLNKFFEDDIQSKQQTKEEFKQYTQLSLFDIE